MSQAPSPLGTLERCLLEEAYRRYVSFSFPPAGGIFAVKREQDSCGRTTWLGHDGSVSVEDRAVIIGQAMFGDNDMMVLATLNVKNRKLCSLPLVVVGDSLWLGDEPTEILLFTD